MKNTLQNKIYKWYLFGVSKYCIYFHNVLENGFES